MKFVLLLIGAVVVAAAPVKFVGDHDQRLDGWLAKFETREAMLKAKAQLATDRTAKYASWSFGNFHAIGGHAPLDKFQQLEGVSYIQNNVKTQIVGTQVITDVGLWGLDRSDQLTLPLNNLYTWDDNAAGQGVNVYVLDTGIFLDHNDWNPDQAQFLADCSDLFGLCIGNTIGDPHGHGTHCAGTIASPGFGIAKNASVWDMKVLNAQGSGGLFGIIAGFDRVVDHNVGGQPKIISMSLGAVSNQALDDAVAAAVAAGVPCIAAAGNENQDACNTSPGGAPEAITAAASDIQDVRASFSNFGQCVDLFAPGVSVLSLGNVQDGTQVFSGTSMACPHTAGAAAILASKGITDPAAIRDALHSDSSKDQISDARGSPNRLLFTNPPANP